MEHESDRDVPRTRGGKVRLRSLDDLDCRTSAARRARDLVSGLEADLGGTEALSTGQREIIKRAAMSGAVCEDLECKWLEGQKIDIGDYALLANSQRRLLATVGLERRAKDISPQDDNLTARFLAALEAAQ
jgi:hypothetical protein